MGLVTSLSKTSNKPAQNNNHPSENQWDEVDARALIAMKNLLRGLGVGREAVWERMRSEETTEELKRGMLAGRREDKWSMKYFRGARVEQVAKLIQEGLVTEEMPKGKRKAEKDDEPSDAELAWEASVKKLCASSRPKL